MNKFIEYLSFHLSQFGNCLNIIRYVIWFRGGQNVPNNGKLAILLTIRQFPLIMIQEIYLGLLLKSAGWRVVMILDDGVLPHWDTFMITKGLTLDKLNPFNADLARRAERRVKAILLKYAARLAGIEIKTLCVEDANKYKSDIDLIRNKYSIEVENANIASSIRYYQTELYGDNPSSEEYMKLSDENNKLVLSGILSAGDGHEPSLIITSHGFLSCWTPARLMSHYYNCKLRVYGQNGHTNGKVLILDKIHNFYGSYLGSLASSGNEENIRIGSELLKGRIDKVSLDSSVYYKTILPAMGREHTKFTIGLFPGLIWDMNIPERNGLFGGVMEWIRYMIEFSKRNDMHVILRFHPAESTMFAGLLSLKDMLKERYGDNIFDDVEIIEASQSVDSHDLVKKRIDAAIVYDGMLGLEIATLGIPSILCAKGRFNHSEINYTPDTIQDLDSLLISIRDKNHKPLNQEKVQESSSIFLYNYCIRDSFDFPMFSDKVLLSFDFSSKNHYRLHDPLIHERCLRALVN